MACGIADGASGGRGEFASLDEVGEEFVEGVEGPLVEGGLEAQNDAIEASADGGVGDAVDGGEILEGTGSEDELGDEVEVFWWEGCDRVMFGIKVHFMYSVYVKRSVEFQFSSVELHKI